MGFHGGYGILRGKMAGHPAAVVDTTQGTTIVAAQPKRYLAAASGAAISRKRLPAEADVQVAAALRRKGGVVASDELPLPP